MHRQSQQPKRWAAPCKHQRVDRHVKRFAPSSRPSLVPLVETLPAPHLQPTVRTRAGSASIAALYSKGEALRATFGATPQARHTLQSDDVQGLKVKRTTKARKGLSWPLENTMQAQGGHRAETTLSRKRAWQIGGSASKKCLEYEPFGSLLPGRNYSSDSYRFGFNGMEKADEINGSVGTHYTTLFRENDVRIGRWWSLDPKSHKFPWQSPYVTFDNNPIVHIDPFGDEVPTTLDRKTRKALGISKKEAKNHTPDQVRDMFATEYGMSVEMRNGNLVHTGDVHTDQQVSADARNMWAKELQPGTISKHSLTFTTNNKKVDIGQNSPLSGERKGPTNSLIDLGDFGADGSVNGDVYRGVPIRAHNFARVMEHEFLGHGVMGLGDDYSQSRHPGNHGAFNGATQTGNTVDFTNQFNRQMGIPERTNYYSPMGRPFLRNGRATQMFQITFSNGGIVITPNGGL